MAAIGDEWEIVVSADAENDFFPLDVKISYYLDLDSVLHPETQTLKHKP
jgi:hypothetical protein